MHCLPTGIDYSELRSLINTPSVPSASDHNLQHVYIEVRAAFSHVSQTPRSAGFFHVYTFSVIFTISLLIEKHRGFRLFHCYEKNSVDGTFGDIHKPHFVSRTDIITTVIPKSFVRGGFSEAFLHQKQKFTLYICFFPLIFLYRLNKQVIMQ